MERKATVFLIFFLIVCVPTCNSAKINTPRVLLPWFENLCINFNFEIIEGGCYTWSLSRDDIIDLEPLYEDTWGHCSKAARVSVSKTCVPPGSVIILAEDVNTGEILRGDVDVDVIRSLKVMSTTWKLYLEEAPEAFEVVAYDEQGSRFSTLEGVKFTWTIENIGSNVNEDPLVMLVKWRDTNYEAPTGITELEDQGLQTYSVLLYGQAMGECRIVVCLDDNICTDFNLNVVASVVLTPATAIIAQGDTIRYRVVRARAGRLTIQDIGETLYHTKLPDKNIALLEDTISLVRGMEIGTTNVFLMSGATEVASATLTVTEPHSIRVTLRPSNLLIRGEVFNVHCIVLDADGHALTAGSEILIRLSVKGDANVDLIRSTENGTITEAMANNAGPLTVTAKLYSVAGKILTTKVEGEVSAVAVDPLEVVPPELYIAWTDTIQEINLKHQGGGEEPVVWSDNESSNVMTVASNGVLTIRGIGDVDVQVKLKKYSHVKAIGRVWSASPEMIQVSSSGHARVGKPHQLHVALTATHPTTGELYNFHSCNCASFSLSLLEGPEPHNLTAAPWIQPVEGACCVLECAWTSRGISTIRVSRGRAGDTTRIAVRAAPTLLWPKHAAALVGATLPVLAEGEALVPYSSETSIADINSRDGVPPHRYPDAQLFTFKCRRKGDARLELASEMDDERESVQLDAACAPHVSRLRLEPPDTPGNCSNGPRIWLRPGHEVSIKVILLDAIGRELLDERGPKVTWDIEPKHPGIEYRTTDRLFIETHPEYAPVPVPLRYYQLVITDEQAIGWTGALKASIPDAAASIQARVVAPLQVDPVKVNVAWAGDTIPSIGRVTGGSGKYSVDAPKGIAARVEDGVLSAIVQGPGSFDLIISDLCVQGERQHVEVYIEEVLSVEVSTSRAVGVGACVPITALVKGVSHRYLSTSGTPEWRTMGHVVVKDGMLCGVHEGNGRVRAALAGVWSPEVEILVFPPLEIIPSKARVPPGAKLHLRHHGGPPQHLATLQYRTITGHNYIEVSSTGSVQGLSMGVSRIRLVATDVANVEMASAESEVEVIPISGLRVRAATQTLLVGKPAPVWVEAGGLSAASLSALHPAPRVTWTLRDSTVARIYTTHADDLLERSVAEGLSIRVVPLKTGIITIDVRVRNMGQVADTRSWDSTLEILGISDIRVSVDGLPNDLGSGDRLSLAVGANVRLKSIPRSSWISYDDGSFELTPNGEVRARRPGFGVIVAQNKDDRNNIYRESAIHVEVAVPSYCTAEPSGDDSEPAIRLVMRNSIGRELLAPEANISTVGPLTAHSRRGVHGALGNELVIPGLDPSGAFMSFQASVSGVNVTDEVWVTGSDSKIDRVYATGGWGVCLEGVGWRAPPGVSLFFGNGVTLALLTKDAPAKHVLKLDRPANTCTVHQIPVDKIEFVPGEWPSTLVPLSIDASSLSSGPLICNEEQRYAMEGVLVELPYTCRTKPPHTAEPVIDFINGQIGCKIIPATEPQDASEVELCAEWGVSRACTRVMLLPPISVSDNVVSLAKQPATFTVEGHPHALRLVKLTPSPGLKLENAVKDGEIQVTVTSDVSACGASWVNVKSKLTAQEIRVEVDRDCDASCGTLLGALFSLLRPYLSTLVTIAAVAVAYFAVQNRLQSKAQVRLPKEPVQTVLPQAESSPVMGRSRTWSRSPYASNGPTVPVYGDTSVLPDSSFSPNTTRTRSTFL